MRDPSPEVRLRAAKALGRIGNPGAARELLRALDDPSRWSTIRVADILAGMGQPAVEQIVAEFPRMGRAGKLAAIDVLGRIRALPEAAWLEERLHDPDPDVRARSCHALGGIGDPSRTPALVRALGDPAWPARAMAAKALGRLADPEAVPALAAAMRDREWWVRTNAALSLAAMGRAGRAALEQVLDGPDRFARHQAVLMLEQTGAVDEWAARLAGERSPERDRAASALLRIVAEGRTARLSALAERHPDGRVREAVRRLLSAGEGR
jgi:HEAT repeat protein